MEDFSRFIDKLLGEKFRGEKVVICFFCLTLPNFKMANMILKQDFHYLINKYKLVVRQKASNEIRTKFSSWNLGQIKCKKKIYQWVF